MNDRALSSKSSLVIALAALLLSNSPCAGGLNFGSHPLDTSGKWTWVRLQGGESAPSVPEPGSLLFLGIGLVAVAVTSRRFR